MAVLYQCFKHDADARAIPELARVLTSPSGKQTEGKNLLLLTYHLIGARSLEDAILGGYVRQVRALDPDCPLPAVHRSGPLLDNADQQRELLGDEKFFATLNASASAAPASSSGLGGLGRRGTAAQPWDAASYGEARNAPVGDSRHNRLVSDLV